MIRALFVTFFMATTIILYIDGRGGSSSNEVVTPLSISHHVVAPIKVKTVSKPFTKVTDDRRFTHKEDIAAQLKRKHRHNLKYAQAKSKLIYPIFASQEPVKKSLHAHNKHRIAIKIKSELKRIGCFRGVISGSWNETVSTALSHFNMSTGQNLKTTEPSLDSLALLQGYSARACRSNYRIAQREKPLIIAHLPVRKPLSNFQTAVVKVEPVKIEPVTSSMSSEAIALTSSVLASSAETPALKRKTIQKVAKRKSRKITRFQQNNVLNYDYFNKAKPKRPKASTVGRRLKATPRRAKKAKRRARQHARLSAKRKHRAKKKRYRKSRRRYRRSRRRFGFNHNGELGYW